MKRAVFSVLILAIALTLTLGLSRSAVRAQDDNPLEVKPILKNYEVMDDILNPIFEQLQAVAVKEPESRKEWKALYIGSYATAEIMNLVFSRNDEDYMAEPDWPKMTAATRQLAENLGASVKTQDYPTVKANYLALVKSCNECHVRFVGEDEVVIEEYPEEEE